METDTRSYLIGRMIIVAVIVATFFSVFSFEFLAAVVRLIIG